MPTPRTDEEADVNGYGVMRAKVSSDFARQLERELAASQQREAALRYALNKWAIVRWTDDGEEVPESAGDHHRCRSCGAQSEVTRKLRHTKTCIIPVLLSLQPAAATGYVRREVLQQCVDALEPMFDGKGDAEDCDRNGQLTGYSFHAGSRMDKCLQAALAAANKELNP